MITIINRQKDVYIDVQWVQAVIQDLLAQTDREAYDIGLKFTSNNVIQKYNKKYRSKEGPTDILSFGLYDDEEKDLGDLILAPAYIKKHTERENLTFDRRLLVLLVHGYCHLLGYDHEDDQEYLIMKTLEDSLLKNLPPSLIR